MPVPIDCKAGNWEQFVDAAQKDADARLVRRLNGACVNAFAVCAMKRAKESGPIGAVRDLPDVLRKRVFEFLPRDVDPARGAARAAKLLRATKKKAVKAIIDRIDKDMAIQAENMWGIRCFSATQLNVWVREALPSLGRDVRWISDINVRRGLEALGYFVRDNGSELWVHLERNNYHR